MEEVSREEIQQRALAALARRAAVEQRALHEPEPLAFRYQVWNSPINVGVEKLLPKNAAEVVAAAAGLVLTEGLTGQGALAAVIALSRSLLSVIQLLPEDEHEVVRLIIYRSREPYSTGIDESDLAQSFQEASFRLDEAMARLVDKGVVRRLGRRVVLTR